MIRPGPRNLITDVDGIQVGNASDEQVRTGVTVVLPDDRAVAGGDVRGGGPGTRETDALDATCLVDAVDAVALSGGSSWGLEAGSGVAAWLGARERGFRVGTSPVVSPIVPGAILFDLLNGGDKNWGEMPPYRDLGRSACEAAGANFSQGNVGAGVGAMTGLYKGGLGSTSAVTPEGIQVGAVVAANAFGSPVIPNTDRLWASLYEQADEMGGQANAPLESAVPLGFPNDTKMGANPGGNTTIGVVATNVALTPAQAKRIAIMAHDGLARAIDPIHTPVDGDALFVLSTGKIAMGEASVPTLSLLGALAAQCVTRAVGRGVYAADPLGDAKSYRGVHQC